VLCFGICLFLGGFLRSWIAYWLASPYAVKAIIVGLVGGISGHIGHRLFLKEYVERRNREILEEPLRRRAAVTGRPDTDGAGDQP
jgi:hypothetical protein